MWVVPSMLRPACRLPPALSADEASSRTAGAAENPEEALRALLLLESPEQLLRDSGYSPSAP